MQGAQLKTLYTYIQSKSNYGSFPAAVAVLEATVHWHSLPQLLLLLVMLLLLGVQ
jgi:hypothetical protein